MADALDVRVTLNGFRVKAETWDDAAEWDGKGDEVFISTAVTKTSAGTTVYRAESQTPVIGDTFKQPGRVQAGSRSSRGGLRTGDSFPTDTPWIRDLSALSASRDYPPFVVWEGKVGPEDVVFINPAIFEWDPGQSFVEGVFHWHKETDDKFGQKAKEIFSGRWPAVGWIFDAVSLGIQTADTLFTANGLMGQSQSRPIGGTIEGNQLQYVPRVVMLSYTNLPQLAEESPSGRGRGVLMIPFQDPPKLRGHYELWLQVDIPNAREVIRQSLREAKRAPCIPAVTMLLLG